MRRSQPRGPLPRTLAKERLHASTQPHNGVARKNGVNTHHETGVSHRVVLAGIAGNVMEWYDFAVYGYFAQAIGQHFFPSRDPTASVIAAFGVFAAGFLMRPIGGLLFGYIGDRISRKAALTLSVLAMAVPTFLIDACQIMRRSVSPRRH